MNKIFTFLIQVLVSLFSLRYVLCKTCPSITTSYNPKADYNYNVRSFLKIPSTNVLIINAYIKDSEGSSVVYYNDMQSPQGEIISVIIPDYVIIEMSYMYKQDKIFAMNHDRIVIANPYTLKSERYLTMLNLVHAQMIDKTEFAITTSKQYTINIIDTNLLVVKKTLDNNKYNNVLNTQNYYTKYFQRQKPSQYIFITVNTYGFFSWTVDLVEFSAIYNDYIGPTIVNNTSYQRQFVKHPTKDIFFVGGYNLEILAFEIVDITTQTYRTQMKLNLINSTNKMNITNIVFKSSTQNSLKPLLIAGDGTSIYDLVLDFDDVNKLITINNYQSPPQVSDGFKTNYTWYEIPEQQDLRIIMSANSFVTLYNYYYHSFNYNLYFGTNWISRRFIYEGNGQSYFVFLREKSVEYYNRTNLAKSIGSNSLLSYSPYSEVNNIYRVKKCEECLIIKTAFNKTFNNFMDQIYMYPPENNTKTSLNITSLGFKWSDVNLNLDPYYYNGEIWVVFGFRNKTADKKYLFTLINMQNPTKNVLLTGATDEVNSRQSSYALFSVDDPDNLEIVGVGNLGYIYVWDFLSPQVIKYQRQSSISCLTSVIGVLYQYNKKKWLIFACDNTKVLSYDFENNITLQVSKLATNPLSLRSFPSTGIITIGDTITGNVYIHKFEDGIFTYFLTILSGSFKDSVISVQLLKEKTIWVQYYYSNIFYSLGDCLDDVNKCQNCEQTHNFNAIQVLDSSITYGNGTSVRPFTSAYNFLTVILIAYRYKELISGVTSMNVNIIVDPQNTINLPKGFLNFDFSPIIQLSIKSSIENKLATLEFNDKLEFSNYNYVGFQDISIQYNFIKSPNECGINFYSISQNVTLNNIQLQAKSPTVVPLNCFQIYVEETNIKVLKLSIQDQDFSNHKSIFSTLYSDWIDIQNLSLQNCLLGDSFSIVTQNSNLIVTMKSISITNNKCLQDLTNEVSSLFSGGLFNVEDLQIKNNNFGNKVIFSSVPSLEQQNYQFQFKQIHVQDNTFTAKTSYLFFNSLYSMRQKPSHSVSFKQVVFENNSLKQSSEDDLANSSLIQTSKILNHEFEDITFKNHHEISFSSIEYSNLVQINKFYCINDEEFLNKSPNSDTGSCLQLYEILSTKIQTIKINYKKAYNNELINLQNKLFYNLSDLDIIDGEFSNMILMQYTINSFSNPFTIYSQNNLTLKILKCNFFDNSLEIVETSQTFSSSALWIQNSLGTVNIIESTFKNSTSNSIYNFMFIQAISLELQGLTFSRSSFGLDTTKHLGGFMNLIINSLKIIDSSFIKSKSQYGSFIYIEAFGNLLNVDITKSNFTEGYAEIDGGAFYIDIKKSQLKLTFTDCFFENIYTYSQGSSTIGFQKYRITSDQHIHEIIYKGGSILNTFGFGDNFFIDIFNMKLSLIDIKEIKPLIVDPKSIDTPINSQFGKTASQQSTLVSSQYSEININGCNLQNFQILNQYSNIPLLINSDLTTVNIVDTNIQDGIFINCAIKVTNGTLTLKNTTFTNFSQYNIISSRQLQVSDEDSENDISSLIVMKDSNLKVSEETFFLSTKCYKNCTGAVFYLMNTNFDISDMSISNSEAVYGGSLYIQGLNQLNQITSCKFENNIAQIDGGAIYLQALVDDKFQFKIENSQILSNSARTGKGGGLFIRSNSQNSTDQLIEIQDTQLIGNMAQIGGGVYQKEISPKILGSTIFKNNVGQTFGNDALSYPTHLRLAKMNEFVSSYGAEVIDKNTFSIPNFRSGDTLKSLSFELVNDQDEVIKPITIEELQNFAVYVQVSQNQNFQNYTIRGNLSASYDSKKSKQFAFQDFNFIGIPGSQATLEFLSDQIYILDKTQVNQYNQNYSFKIIINFRKCIQGEIVKVYGSFTECSICQAGKYSFDLQECNNCPTGATCAGGSQLVSNQGYWRSDNKSTKFISCSQQENCVGGSFGNNVCYEGHIGALCEECDIKGEYWMESYTISEKNSCTNCKKIAYNTWFVFLVTLWTLVSMALAIRGDVQTKLYSNTNHLLNIKRQNRQSVNNMQKSQISQQNNKESVKNFQANNQTDNMKSSNISYLNDTPNNQQRARNLSIFRKKSESKQQSSIKQKKENINRESSSIYIKILTNYFQIVSSVATFNLSIPSGIFGIHSSVGQPLKNTMNSVDCFLKDFETQIPFIYFRQMVSFMIPIGYFLIFFLGLLIMQMRRKGKFQYYILSTAAMFLIIYIQPDLVSQLISLVSCKQIGDNSYILANVSYECFTQEHQKYALFFIFPALTTWVLVLPLFLFAMLYKNRNDLSKFRIKMIYGFLYKEYKQEAFYWEFIKMIEKICIILSLNFYYSTINVKAFLVFVIIVVYGILAIIVEPFEDEDYNSLDNYSTTICGLSVLLGLFIYQNPFSYFYYSSLGVIIIINIFFVFTILKKIINVYIKRLEKVLIKLAMRVPSFRAFLKPKQEGKKFNPIVKQKIKKLFENYLMMSDEEKQKTKIKILKSSFKLTLSNMFGDYEGIDNDLNQKSVQFQQISNDRKFCHLNSSEEQNNLLTCNSNLSPLLRPLYSIEDTVNDEEKQQKRAQFRLSVLSQFENAEKNSDKPLDSEQNEIQTEEFKGNWSNRKSKYHSKKNKFLNFLNNQKTNDDLIRLDQSNYSQSSSYNMSPLMFPSDKEYSKQSQEDEIKTNGDQNEDSQQIRAMARLSVLDNFKLENEVTPNQDEKEKSDKTNDDSNEDNQQKRATARLSVLDNFKLENEVTPNQDEKEKNDIYTNVKHDEDEIKITDDEQVDVNIYYSKEIKNQKSLKEEMTDSEGIQVIIKNEESQIEDIQIEEKQPKELDKDDAQSGLHNSNIIQIFDQDSMNESNKIQNSLQNSNIIQFSEQDIDIIKQDSYQVEN